MKDHEQAVAVVDLADTQVGIAWGGQGMRRKGRHVYLNACAPFHSRVSQPLPPFAKVGEWSVRPDQRKAPPGAERMVVEVSSAPMESEPIVPASLLRSRRVSARGSVMSER